MQVQRFAKIMAVCAATLWPALVSTATDDVATNLTTINDNLGVEPVAYRSSTGMEQRLQELEARLASLEQTSVEQACCETTGDCCASACDAGCCGSACSDGCGCMNSCWCNTGCGCTYSADLLFLRTHGSDGDEDRAGEDYDTASRYTLGYMTGCGREWRVRYFEYATEIDEGDEFLQLEYVDAEYAGRFTWGCNWRGELSAGLRWAQTDESDNLAYSDSIGPVLGAVLYGPTIWGLDTFAGVRHSWQFGHPWNNSDNEPAEFSHFSVSEVQLGMQYNTSLMGRNAFARGIFEVQSWDGMSQTDTENQGLVGLGFALGMTH
jgi:hypothetical protein